ncbi:hypothetical protein PYW08_010303 [Mythimna loreyi]|uniref:Uncharacterized protein n=1 Tax=Mythimna loreyi TaxID=667449 RepID=A0ACC2Q4P8_9NEOP|nr:hypothetical protein PYW08_010303 [Mythimna loreyi]
MVANLFVQTPATMAFDISPYLTLLLALFGGNLFPPQAKLTNEACFDFIIVGGGTAGCVLARKMAQNNYSVLVLEAGGRPNAVAMAPGLFFTLPGTSFDYDFRSTYDPYAAYAQGNKTRLTSGKALGGSSAINHFLNVRPPPSDYNNLAESIGDDSWNYKNLLPYFKKSENMKDQEIAKKYAYYHGTDGPIGVSRLVSNAERVETYLKAQAEAGNPTVEDLNSDTNTGYSQPQYTIARDGNNNKEGGIRQTTSYSYLKDIKDSPYLHVSTETTVTKIIFEDKTAVGVEAVYKGKKYIFKANKEVILSAGTFNSPKILQLSGVGPKEHLESLGIEVKADLPVGDNLIIAPAVAVVTKAKKHWFPINVPALLPALNPTILPFPVVVGSAALNKSSNIPDQQSYNLMLPYGTPFDILACPLVYGYNIDICLNWQKQLIRNDGIFSVIVNLDVKSRGSVRLNTTNVDEDPIITTGFYKDPTDLDNFVNLLSDFTSFVDSPSMVDYATVVPADECAEYEKNSSKYWACYILHRTIASFLYSGTCAMGSVVDNNLFVKGFKNLRVVDASVFPKPLHSLFNPLVIAMAEKISDQIINEKAQATMAFDLSPLVTLALALFGGVLFPPQAKLTNSTCYDYIIVGGGTAGCVLARRLAEKNCSVLVLERGGLPNAISLAPGLFFTLPKTSIDYDYKSTLNPYAAGAQGNFTRLTAGRALGGSSVVNHLLHLRPSSVDYDSWSEITGDDSWRYENILPYFKKSENMKDQEIAEDYSYYHGTDGPIGISRLVSDKEDVLSYLKAQAEAGNPTVEDLNSDINTGYSQPQYTIARDGNNNKEGGIRQTTSYSYFKDIKDSPYLHVSTKTTVKKIIFEDKTAVGVEAVYKGETYIFKANKEVILCAGAFNSPQILQLSGVGPKEHLESFGIEVKADLPVGDNLIIPPAVVIVTKTEKHWFPLNGPALLPALNPTKLPFPVIVGSGALNKSSNIPNYQNYNLAIPYGTPFELLACPLVYGYNIDICLNWQKQLTRNDGIFSVLVNLETKSTGTVRLNSTDVDDDPIITTGFYDNPEDLDNFVVKMMDFMSYVKSPSMVKLGAKVVVADECSQYEENSVEYCKCYILARNISPFLYSGTCPMGSVVDGNLKVIGFEKLRVADASVFPRPMHGAFNAAVIALAEKIVDQILSENGECLNDTKCE